MDVRVVMPVESFQPDMVVIFEISLVSIPGWWLPLVAVVFAAAVLACRAGVVWAGKALAVGGARQPAARVLRWLIAPVWRASLVLVGAAAAVLGCVWLLASSFYVAREYDDLAGRFARGDYGVAAGCVHGRGAVKDEYGDPLVEFFVQDVEFILSEEVNAYILSHIDQGLLQNGAYVRIGYHPHYRAILQLEVPREALRAGGRAPVGLGGLPRCDAGSRLEQDAREQDAQ